MSDTLKTAAQKQNLTVVKIGGNILDDEQALSQVLTHFAILPGYKLLVHGGGKIATELATKLGAPQKMIEGRRVTDSDTLDIITMVYGGLISKTLVAQLHALGLPSIGVSGADGDLIRAVKRPTGAVDYGLVGDIVNVNSDRLINWMNDGLTPIIAPLAHDGHGQILNINADSIATSLAVALSKSFTVSLVYSFEKNGVLLDVNNEDSLLRQINPTSYQKLRADGKIFAGMIPKLDNAFSAVAAGVKQVILGKAQNLPQLIEGTAGTRISNGE